MAANQGNIQPPDFGNPVDHNAEEAPANNANNLRDEGPALDPEVNANEGNVEGHPANDDPLNRYRIYKHSWITYKD
jgi:hypothetical protein